jgi:two-component system, chemotaxis family, chemotaxis protein CheY
VNVLVVDDDSFIREMLEQLLEDEGYSVASAADGEEALSYLQQQQTPPCLILLDLMMPRMNGWEFRAAQRRDPLLAPIPVVTISAHADLLATADPLDATAHFPKPIDMARLITTINRYCKA